jgi:ubiquinone/menaquinone biosynthesis C-methylase UbiE
MLLAARGFLTERGVGNAEYVIAAVEQLPFLDAAFDLVTVRIAPHHFADAGAAVHEMARVLRPGGRLVVIDNLAPDDPALDTFMNEIEWRRDPSHVRAYSEMEWRRMLGDAGLVVTHIERDRKTHAFAEWAARAQMPDAARLELEHDMLAAAPEVRAYFAITAREGSVASWISDVLIARAERPPA